MRTHPSSAPSNNTRRSAATCAAVLIVFALLATSWSAAASVISLGAAENVAVLGSSTVTNTGPTIVTGNVALSPGVSVTGFGPGTIVGGSIHIGDALATQAHADAATAYGQLVGQTPTTDLSGQNLGTLAMALTPGVYHFDTVAVLNGTLNLDTGGNPDATFIFQIGTTLTTAVASNITLPNGDSANIFWQVGTSATIDVDSVFYGTIVADQSITLNSGAILNGRAIAINGAVTMDTNRVNAPAVPEPATWLTGALAFGVIGFTERRRIRKSLVKLSGPGTKSA
jgi:type VI secretion system secreted protein VgrG